MGVKEARGGARASGAWTPGAWLTLPCGCLEAFRAGPVAAEPGPDGIRLVQPAEPETGVQKEIEIRLLPGVAGAQVTHRLVNRSRRPMALAPWALTVMSPGGVAILPHSQRGAWPEQLSPTHTLTLWAFSDMHDPRWSWGEQYVLLRHDPAMAAPQKIGLLDTEGWIAYRRAGHLFVKHFAYRPEATYPDMGSTVETFANDRLLEIETLGPLSVVEPGDATEHVEHWRLYAGVGMVEGDESVRAEVLPRVREEQPQFEMTASDATDATDGDPDRGTRCRSSEPARAEAGAIS